MSRKAKVVDQMSEYFARKHKILTMNEYIKANDGPVTVQGIKRTCGSWIRLTKLCERSYPERMEAARKGVDDWIPPVEPVKKVIPEPHIITAAEALEKLKAKQEA